MKEINTNQETLKRNKLDLIELEHILIKTQIFFEQVCSTNLVCKPLYIVLKEIYHIVRWYYI